MQKYRFVFQIQETGRKSEIYQTEWFLECPKKACVRGHHHVTSAGPSEVTWVDFLTPTEVCESTKAVHTITHLLNMCKNVSSIHFEREDVRKMPSIFRFHLAYIKASNIISRNAFKISLSNTFKLKPLRTKDPWTTTSTVEDTDGPWSYRV